ncbi:MAG: branched-chain amino acid ABC transporter permease [Firmicutes bacterium]|nr:branched-chain amino acid ABC transporter permease [Bacillota bacterium]
MTGFLSGMLITVGINIIAVLGPSILLGFTGMFTFGHAAYEALGAYTSAVLTMRYSVPFPLALLCGCVVAMLCSIPIGVPTLHLTSDYFIVATLGVGEIVALLMENLDKITGGGRGLPGVPLYTNLPITAVLVIACIWVTRNFVNSRHGRNCVAIRENQLAAECIGINAFKHKMIAFMISAFLGGLSGGLMAHYVGLLHPKMFRIVRSEELGIAVILGGAGSVTGSVLAAIVVTLLPELLRDVVSDWRLVVYGLAVIVVIINRPQGLMGYREITLESLRGLWSRLAAGRKRPAAPGAATTGRRS